MILLYATLALCLWQQERTPSNRLALAFALVCLASASVRGFTA